MPRYIRVRADAAFFAGVSGDASGVEEIEISATNGGADVTSTANTISSFNGGGTIEDAHAFDNTTDAWAWGPVFGSGSVEWVGQDFGADQDVEELRITWSDDSGIPLPDEAWIEYSDDNVVWTEADNWTPASLSETRSSLGLTAGGGDPDPPAGINDRGCWSRSSGTLSYVPGTSWSNPGTGFAPDEDLNENTAFSYNDATNTITLPATIEADGYLLKGMFEYEDTSNGRHNPQGRFVQTSGTGNFVSSVTSGYNRDTSEDRSYATFWAFIDNPSASAEIQLQIQRDNDAPTGGIVLSQLCAIPMWYDDIGMYSSADTNVPGTTTPADITSWATIFESDTAAIERVANRVTFKSDNKKSLLLGSQYWESSSGARTQRLHGFSVNGVFRNDSRNYSYIRNGSNNEAGDMFTMLLESGTSDITIDHQCFLGEPNGSGLNGLLTHADVAGSTGSSLGAHAWVVLDLPATAEGFYSYNSGQANQFMDLSGARSQLNVCPLAGVEFADAAAFTRTNDSGMNAVKDMKLLVGGAANGGYTSESGARFTGYMAMTLDGVDQILTKAGDYGRGNQGSQDTYAVGFATIATLDITAGQDLGVSAGRIVGGESGPVSIAGGGASMWALNLDSIVPDDTPPSATAISVWDGSAFVERHLNHFDGSAWDVKPLKRWNGSAFV